LNREVLHTGLMCSVTDATGYFTLAIHAGMSSQQISPVCELARDDGSTFNTIGYTGSIANPLPRVRYPAG
jgi:hypothetical protein